MCSAELHNVPTANSESEILDVIDPETGGVLRPEIRAVVHSKGLWHMSEHLWLHDGGGFVVLQLRSAAKESYPKLWDVSSAGHVPAGSNTRKTAVREAAEELGVDIPDADLRLLFTQRVSFITRKDKQRAFINRELVDVFVACIHDDDILAKCRGVPNPEVDDVCLASVRDVAALIDGRVTTCEARSRAHGKIMIGAADMVPTDNIERVVRAIAPDE